MGFINHFDDDMPSHRSDEMNKEHEDTFSWGSHEPLNDPLNNTMRNVCSIKDFTAITSVAIRNLVIKELYDLLAQEDEHCDCISKENIRERISELTEEINQKG